MLYNKEQVMAFLPHRDPFLFVDSIDSIEGVDKELIPGEVVISLKEIEGIKVVGNFHVKKDLAIFDGHFPGNPVLPGVIQIEMMAQVACFSVTKLYADPFSITLNVALMGVSSSKFRKPVLPGMDVEIHAVCTKSRGMIMSYDCQLYNNGNLMSEVSVLASVKLT